MYDSHDGWNVTMAGYFGAGNRVIQTHPELFIAPDGTTYKRKSGAERVDAIIRTSNDLPDTKLRLWDDSLPAKKRADLNAGALRNRQNKRKKKRKRRKRK